GPELASCVEQVLLTRDRNEHSALRVKRDPAGADKASLVEAARSSRLAGATELRVTRGLEFNAIHFSSPPVGDEQVLLDRRVLPTGNGARWEVLRCNGVGHAAGRLLAQTL